MKALFVALVAFLLSAPFVLPPAVQMAKRAVGEYQAGNERKQHIADLWALQQQVTSLQSALGDAQLCRLIVNDGRKFAWTKRADGWCYTIDLDKQPRQ